MKNKVALILSLFPLSAFAQSNYTPVYEAIDQNINDQMLTTRYGESSESYRYFEDAYFYVSTASFPGMHALYRCHVRNAHYASNQVNCEAGERESTYGFIFDTQVEDTVALNRYYNPNYDKYFVTPQFLSDGPYVFQGTLGYVYPGEADLDSPPYSGVFNYPQPAPQPYPVPVPVPYPQPYPQPYPEPFPQPFPNGGNHGGHDHDNHGPRPGSPGNGPRPGFPGNHGGGNDHGNNRPRPGAPGNGGGNNGGGRPTRGDGPTRGDEPGPTRGEVNGGVRNPAPAPQPRPAPRPDPRPEPAPQPRPEPAPQPRSEPSDNGGSRGSDNGGSRGSDSNGGSRGSDGGGSRGSGGATRGGGRG